MPAPITTTALKPTKMVERSFSQPQPKKTRIARRRGRAKNGLESDEEIEREVRTDSETDDDQSSTDSESESESVSDDAHPNGRSEVVTPSTTQSPPPMEIDSLINGIASKSPANGDSGIFVDSTDWADMVAEENAHGASDLPVIDFADLDRHHVEHPLPPPARARKPHKIHKRPAPARALSAPPSAPPAPSSEHEDTGRVSPIDEPIASTSQELPGSAFPNRVRGQSARQAYQQRLETDPSYVPTVGEFWGHDDRLLDKDLRSLSGWWRGRWQTRGRGRGTFGMRGRGRGFYPVPSVQAPSQEDDGEGHDDGPTGAVIEVPPIEQAWTHDGFEEMKRRDERHRSVPQQPQAPFTPLRGFGYRGRGGFVGGRGRGGFGRGGYLASPTGPRQGLPNFAMSGRPWFAMKPERMWTKQHEAFLYFDPALKPRAGQGPGFRVRLPGGKGQIVRLSPQSFAPPSLPLVAAATPPQDDGEKFFIVKIPRRSGKEKAVEGVPTAAESSVVEEAATTMAELSLEEVFTVRPNAVPNRRIDLGAQEPSSDLTSHPPSGIALSKPVTPSAPPGLQLRSPSSISIEVEVESQQRIEVHPSASAFAPGGNDSSSVQIQETVVRNAPPFEETAAVLPIPAEERAPAPPVLHPLQTAFSPVPPTSPPYGSPYGYPPTLPPGVAMGRNGMPYELATGRPVYLQATPPPPPPPMFTPRPMMHAHMHHPSAGAPFVPAHMHQHSATSPDFLSHPHTPPMTSFVDPSTGVPIFAPARQSSRIEIRAPTDATEGKKSAAPRPSTLRSSISGSATYPSAEQQQPRPMFFPNSSLPAAGEPGMFPPGEALPSTVEQPQVQVVDPGMGYPPYQQQYYYPESYAYPPYVDMSSQVVHYEMYPADPRGSQPVIYY